MNFNAYIERQKNMIRQRNCGQTAAEENEKCAKACVERLFAELDGLQGLNVRERMFYAMPQNACAPCYSKA